MNYLGLDWGRSKIGVAIGSNITKTAVPLEIIKLSNKAAIARIQEIVVENDIDELVVGVPTLTKVMSNELETFVARLKQEIKLPVHIFDERATTKLAKEFIGRKKCEDSVAAMIILQNFLDSTVRS